MSLVVNQYILRLSLIYKYILLSADVGLIFYPLFLLFFVVFVENWYQSRISMLVYYCVNGLVFVTLFMLLGICIALTFLCLSYARAWISMFDWFGVWEVVIRFVDIGWVVYQNCLYSLFIITYFWDKNPAMTIKRVHKWNPAVSIQQFDIAFL